MLSKGMLASEEVQANVGTKLEQAIEDLRVKYAKIEAEKAAADAAAAAAAAAEAEKAAAKEAENDWSLARDDPELEALRQARIAALKSTAASKRGAREAGHGSLRDIAEGDFLSEVTGSGFVVVHFFHPEFETCRVMEKHLRLLAAAAPQTKFVALNATRSPFFVAKLKVRTLPTLVFFVDGVAVGRQLGYDGLRITVAPVAGGAAARAAAGAGGASSAASTDFSTASLARVLRAAGVLGTLPLGGGLDNEEDDDEDDGGEGAAAAAAARRRRVASGSAMQGAADAAADLALARKRMLAEMATEEV